MWVAVVRWSRDYFEYVGVRYVGVPVEFRSVRCGARRFGRRWVGRRGVAVFLVDRVDVDPVDHYYGGGVGGCHDFGVLVGVRVVVCG